MLVLFIFLEVVKHCQTIIGPDRGNRIAFWKSKYHPKAVSNFSAIASGYRHQIATATVAIKLYYSYLFFFLIRLWTYFLIKVFYNLFFLRCCCSSFWFIVCFLGYIRVSVFSSISFKITRKIFLNESKVKGKLQDIYIYTYNAS